MKRRDFLASSLGLVAAGTLIGAPTRARADTLADIKARKKVLIAVDLGSPPFGMTDATMQPIGADVESARLLAEHLGYPLEIVEVTSPNRVAFLLTGKADLVMASFSVTEERKKVIDFSDPYGVIQSVVAAPKDVAIKGVADIVGKRVGTTRGSTNDKEVTAQAVGADIVRYDDDSTLVTALVSGQVGIMASSPQIMAAVNPRIPANPLEVKFVLKTNPYAVGIRKGDDALRAAVNEWVHANLKNRKLDEIYKRYNGVALPEEMLK
ncbi:transporter substrate-binding domain-containing protein [Siculibacillus lacustris]|uniref:Transporter substrate-binding domain-containing protein n=1 Tax=Siculibacillus lacustris TaxID=1549641 RepID=A0A4Q9VWH7_9HYPH|nr:transporter substrate-binding domain-containing protein [Siculibacillus lacustris]TBW40675.1 transporter substrate-binding domain-containing protein [Siculibacillus lacustris]